MMSKVNVGIVGLGNLGKGVVKAINKCPDMNLSAIFTRRNPGEVKVDNDTVKIVHISEVEKYVKEIDVMILCGGSATDLPQQGPELASLFNTVDSFDTHAKIPEYFEQMDHVASAKGKLSIISVGWDPGLFSINRLMGEAILPDGETYTFWGKGVSQGHSDAIRRVEGVKAGVQYTVPIEASVNRVRSGENPTLSTKEKHERICYVVPEPGYDRDKITEKIKTMPNYFSDYHTKVYFITEEELRRDHSKLPHGGFVIRSGKTGEKNKQIIEYSLQLESNPEFTASVLVAYARAAFRLHQEGHTGAKTVFDIAPAYLSPKTAAQLRKELL
ncbi:diaminopimelate dehydrogenase [Bacillus kwashiorkori]|uniref:diaminopimelate dehydrogenase n=1 Tax=Bacillus kwashiorkori TaxID=1522318 RepID=UPI000783D696|nr:diaminopimelate dehydrogenase [Bacillus kwashiorkori]